MPSTSFRSQLLGWFLLALAAAPALGQLGAPPVPAGNPITPEKTILGKILFWDEQLSTDNTVACGTCHRPEDGGSDPRFQATPGLDGMLGTADDPFGSPGIVRSDSDNEYEPDSVHGFLAQVTSRNSQSFIGAQYFDELFWDGRAPGRFVDPQTGNESLATGGALESQSVEPPLSSVEMAHDQRTWSQLVGKLAQVIPLRLATDLTPDIVAALALDPTYPDLFESAFGDSAINSERIAFALATYQRTLVPDFTPWDRFQAGETTALSERQLLGFNLMIGINCLECHAPPLFSNGSFRNIGLRPAAEDLGRQLVTGNTDDRGKFKVPSLRNVSFRKRYMHNGQFDNLFEVVEFYNRGGDFADNQDVFVEPLNLPFNALEAIVDFLFNGLLDPRVPLALPPFDRPTLHSETTPDNPNLFGAGSIGSGGEIPQILALSPPNIANPEFKVGISNGLGGANAFLVISNQPTPPGTFIRGGIPLHVRLDTIQVQRMVALKGTALAPGEGHATFKGAVPNQPALVGRKFYVQWFVEDPAAIGGFAASAGAELTVF